MKHFRSSFKLLHFRLKPSPHSKSIHTHILSYQKRASLECFWFANFISFIIKHLFTVNYLSYVKYSTVQYSSVHYIVLCNLCCTCPFNYSISLLYRASSTIEYIDTNTKWLIKTKYLTNTKMLDGYTRITLLEKSELWVDYFTCWWKNFFE